MYHLLPVEQHSTGGVLDCKPFSTPTLYHDIPLTAALGLLSSSLYQRSRGVKIYKSQNHVMELKIKTELISSGEHAGWWCASYNGLGVFSPIKEVAISSLRNLLDV